MTFSVSVTLMLTVSIILAVKWLQSNTFRVNPKAQKEKKNIGKWTEVVKETTKSDR